MNVESFTEFKSGQLDPIEVGKSSSSYAFIPNLLPADWQPDLRIWPLIAEARAKVASLNGAGGILPNPQLLLRPLQQREAIKSNSIEGTFVNPEEFLLYQSEKDSEKESKNEQLNDWREVAYYDQALREGCARIARGDPIDRKLICDLHRILLRSSRGKNKSPGIFREQQVYVGGARYIPPPPTELETLLENLEIFLKSESYDPLVRAFIAHYQFEAIHPFLDGNGRIGRLILSLCVYQWLNQSSAWLYLSEYFEKNKDEYIKRLFLVSSDGDWSGWVEFCLRGTIEQSAASEKRCQKLLALKNRYEAEVGIKSKRMMRIISMLLSSPILEIADLARSLGVTYPTAKSDVAKLEQAGILVPLKGLNSTVAYSAREIFAIAYMD
jgi:Fic family protein